MAENSNELFKVVKKGGYDKEDVQSRFQAVREAASIEKAQLTEQIDAKNKEIAELKEQTEEQKSELTKLHRDISEKYQSYIDNYDTIGEIIVESRVQAKKVVEDAYTERDRILGNAQQAVDQAVEEARNNTLGDLTSQKEQLEADIAAKQAEYSALCAKVAELNQKIEAAKAAFDASALSIRKIAEEEGLDTQEEILEIPDPEGDAFDVADTHEIDFERLTEE